MAREQKRYLIFAPDRTSYREKYGGVGNLRPARALNALVYCRGGVAMEIFRRAEELHWNQLKMQEQLVMLAMTGGPQKHVEWRVQRTLCYHRLAEITLHGLRLTWQGRQV